MRVIVTGCRDWGYALAVWDALDGLRETCRAMQTKLTVVHGGCRTGADKFAHDFCFTTGTEEEVHPAQWDRYGKAAGPFRNTEMAESGADLVLAFWDGKSQGTGNMIRKARERNLPTIVRYQ